MDLPPFVGKGWASVLCLSILLLNPLVLDFFSAARGYSLGMGFLFLGVWALLLQLREDKTQIRWRVSRSSAYRWVYR